MMRRSAVVCLSSFTIGILWLAAWASAMPITPMQAPPSTGAQTPQAASSPVPSPSPSQTGMPSPASGNPPPHELPTPAPAPKSAPDTQPATVLKTTTRLVIIDVVATDGRGRPITDLKPADFTLLEDGKEQKVRAFGFQHPTPHDPKFQTPKLPSNVFTNIPLFEQTGPLNILLLDALNTNLPNQFYAREQMIKYLEKMPEGQPIAVYALGTRLRMLQDFTSDPKILKEALKNFKGQSSPLQDNPTGGPDTELFSAGSFDSLPADVQSNIQSFEAERISFQTDLRVRITRDALQALAQTLAGYQGRKNLIWVSEAFPLNIYPDGALGAGTFSSQRSYSQDMLKTANALIDAQVAVYPVDAQGLVGIGMNAASSGRDKFGRNLNGPGFGKELSRQSAALIAAHETMSELADRTGGKAYYNRNDLDGAVRNSIDDGGTYYMVGYYPDNKNWDGKFRKLQIKVDRSGVKLRHRLGYYAADPQSYTKEDPKARRADLARALNLDSPPSTMLMFQAGVDPPTAQTGNKVVIRYAIDTRALLFEQGADGLEHADIECVGQAYSPKGKPVKINGSTLQLSLKPETFKRVMQTGLPCSHDVDLPAGDYLLKLAVRDGRTGLIGTANAKVTVPPLTSPTTVLTKPEEMKAPDAAKGEKK